LNGCNLIHDCGYLEFGSTASFESVLFSDEIIGMLKYMLQPLNFTDESVALNVIDKVGPGNSFLMEHHTNDNYKKSFFFPRFLNRQKIGKWEREGGKDIHAILNDNARKIYHNHQPQELRQAVKNSIAEIIARHQPDFS
jgi:trimethylamine--corrinoid protein Co-methyltransferase